MIKTYRIYSKKTIGTPQFLTRKLTINNCLQIREKKFKRKSRKLKKPST